MIPSLYSKGNPIFYLININLYWRIINHSLCFWWYTQNNIDYLIQNMTQQVIQNFHSTLELIFRIYCFSIIFLYLSMYSRYYDLIKQYLFCFITLSNSLNYCILFKSLLLLYKNTWFHWFRSVCFQMHYLFLFVQVLLVIFEAFV